jgi:hypothetical protein
MIFPVFFTFISLARGHEVSALDIASIAVPSLKLAKLGAKD